MRITIFSLIAVLFMAINGSACSEDNPVFGNKSDKTLKFTKNTCDLCGCYMGLDLESKSQLGVRYRLRTFDNEAFIPEQPGSSTDHTVHTSPGSTSRETYNTFEIYAKYFVTKALQVSLTLPFSNNNIEGNNYNGPGDLTAIIKYNLLKAPRSRYSVSKFYFGAGIKLPTGRNSLVSPDGDIEPHFQSGTGSTDFIFTGDFYASNGILGINFDNVIKLNTRNKNKYRFANRFNTAINVFINIAPSTVFNLIPNAGFYLESAGNDISNDEKVTDSGGTVMFLSMGSNIKINHVSIGIDIQKPVFEDLNGKQSSNNLRFSFSTGYIF